MRSTIIFTFLVLTLNSTFNLNACYAATLPVTENNATETTAMAKTTDTLMDVFEDVRWFFERLAIFCDTLQKMLPAEVKQREQPPISVGYTLQAGLKHFIFGVREISRSIVRVLSDKEVREYKQLSRATDFAHDVIKSTGEFFRSLRIFIANVFATYTFYMPELMLTKCMGNYIFHTYPERPMYEYPVLMINEIIDAFRTTIDYEIENPENVTETDRKLRLGSEVTFDRNVEQNEILDEDMYVFHNTPVSPTPELMPQIEETTPENDDEDASSSSEATLEEHFMDKLMDKMEIPNWKQCVQMYATETIFRKLEFYFMEIKG